MYGFARGMAGLALGAVLVLGQDAHHKGVHPRATPDDYAVKAGGKGPFYAASLVPSDEAKHLFPFDITGKFLVFEVAYFPQENRSAELDVDDFVMKHKGETTHSADAVGVASAVQKVYRPREFPSRLGDTTVTTEANVGYERGTDPVTGQRRSGTYTGGGVGVERGGPEQPPYYPSAGSSPEDHKLLVEQLEARQFPSGKFDHPVAGYLYFAKSSIKKDSNGNYLLEHLGAVNGSGASETVELAIPAKNH